MSALTSGPFGPGNRPPAMPGGDYRGREGGSGETYGIRTRDGDAWFGLDGQPPPASSRGWGDMSWRFSTFYSRPGGLPVVGDKS